MVRAGGDYQSEVQTAVTELDVSLPDVFQDDFLLEHDLRLLTVE